MRNNSGAEIREAVADAPPSHLNFRNQEPLPGGRGNSGGDGDGKLDEVVGEFKGYFDLLDKLTKLVAKWLAMPKGIPDQSLAESLGDDGLFNDRDKRNLYDLKGVDVGSLAGLTARLKSVGSAMDALDRESASLRADMDENWQGRGSDTAGEKFNDLSSAARAGKGSSGELAANAEKLYISAYNAKLRLLKFVHKICEGGDETANSSVMNKKIDVDADHSEWDVGQDGDSSHEVFDTGMNEIKSALTNGITCEGKDRFFVSDDPAEDSKVTGTYKVNGIDYPKYIPGNSVTGAILNTNDMLKLSECGYYSDQIVRGMNMLSKYYVTTLVEYRRMIDQIRGDMSKSMSEVHGALGGIQTDPFKDLVGPGEPPPKQEKRDTGGEPKKQEPRDTGGGDTGPAKTGGGEAVPQQGGDGPSSGGSTMPPPPRDSGGTPTMPTPGGQTGGGQPSVPTGNGGTPQMSGMDGQQGSSMPQMPGLTSTQGMADQQDGAAGQPGMPGIPGQAMPGQQDGQPASVKMTGPGGHDLELTSPDGQGHIRVSVDDGSGHPQKFDVDFGQGQQGQHGQQGQPGMPDQPGSSPVSQVLGGLRGDHGGSPDAGPGQDGAQHVQADQSGHAQFKAGENTISVDKAPGSDEVKVTVDDGSGKPTTMTVDSGGDAPGQGQPSPAGLGDSSDAGGPALGGGDTGGLGHDPGGTHPADARGADGGASVGSSPDPGAMPGGGGGAGGDLGSAPDAGMGQQQQPLQQGPTTGAEPSGSGGGGPHGGGADVGHSPAPQSGGAPAGGGGGGAHGGGGMGMPMMGGMGMGGAGGDQERGASSWRTEGNLFDDADNSVAADFAEEALRGADNENWR